MSEIKLVALDMDGTLLTDSKQLTEHTRRTLEAAIAAGVAVVPASGRNLSSLPQALMELPGIRYAITCNGASVIDLQKKAAVCQQLVPKKTVLDLMDLMEGTTNVIEVCLNDCLYIDHCDVGREAAYTPENLRVVLRALRSETEDLRRLVKESGSDAEKVLIFTEDHEALKEVQAAICVRHPELAVTFSIRNNLEINAGVVSKGSGLRALAEYLKLPRESVMACGDSGNDVEMLKAAGFSVAMGNAIPEVLQLADAVTATNNEDGVAVAIERYVLGAGKKEAAENQ